MPHTNSVAGRYLLTKGLTKTSGVRREPWVYNYNGYESPTERLQLYTHDANGTTSTALYMLYSIENLTYILKLYYTSSEKP